MKKWVILVTVLLLCACNAKALRHTLTPAPGSTPNHDRIQFDCTVNGFYIFDGFPDIVRADRQSVGVATTSKDQSMLRKNIAEKQRLCLTKIEKPFRL